jgi:hypothetical protein
MTDFSKAFSGLPKQEGQPDPSAMFEQLARVTEELKVYNYVLNGVMVALSAALIVVGYQLFHRKPLSRTLSIGWALAALAYLPISLYIQTKDHPPQDGGGDGADVRGIGRTEGLMQGCRG